MFESVRGKEICNKVAASSPRIHHLLSRFIPAEAEGYSIVKRSITCIEAGFGSWSFEPLGWAFDSWGFEPLAFGVWAFESLGFGVKQLWPKSRMREMYNMVIGFITGIQKKAMICKECKKYD